MIIVDREMPLNCRECPSRQRSEKNMGKNYCMEMLGKPIKSDIFTKRADFCPIKCDIEDIKAEIEQTVNEEEKINEKWSRGLYHALKIIDKHIKGEQIEKKYAEPQGRSDKE